MGLSNPFPPAVQGAYTQTYSTANKTIDNLTSATLTDSTGATPNTTVENVPAAVAADVDVTAASLASTNTALTAAENNISDLAAQVNALRVDLIDVKQAVNSLIDDLQALGTVG